MDLNHEVMLFELSLDGLCQSMPVRYQAISKYPRIRRDLSLLVNAQVATSEIEQAVRAVVSAELLKSFDVFDVYMGASIPDGKKSLAIALTLQDDNRTLVDAEVNEVIAAVLKKLADDYSIALRDV
jgi:phenylalanyl-tRNA synthetase beta chain